MFSQRLKDKLCKCNSDAQIKNYLVQLFAKLLLSYVTVVNFCVNVKNRTQFCPDFIVRFASRNPCLTVEQTTRISNVMKYWSRVYARLWRYECDVLYIVRCCAFYFTVTTPCLQLSSYSRTSILTAFSRSE